MQCGTYRILPCAPVAYSLRVKAGTQSVKLVNCLAAKG